jgi:nitrogen regulatory protein PII
MRPARAVEAAPGRPGRHRWPPATAAGEHGMKLLKAIIRPNKVDDVKDALARLNISGMTVTEVRGHGRQKGHTAVYRGKEYNVSLLPKMQIEAVVIDAIAEDAIRAIVEAARTGEIGDGRVFVLPVERTYKIRTGEQDL